MPQSKGRKTTAQNTRDVTAYRARKKAKAKKAIDDVANDLLREYVEAIGYGRGYFNLACEEHPDAGHEGETVIRMVVRYPDDAARLNVLRLAEAHGLEVWELEDRVMTQGLKNFTGKASWEMVE